MSDPSMEDILASIRKILADETVEEQQQAPAPEPVAEEVVAPEPIQPEPAPMPEPVAQDDDVMDLTSAQMISPEPAPVMEPIIPAPIPQAPELIAQPVAKASACTLTYLAQKIAEDRNSGLGNAGLTIEDIVRESIKPIIKEWLNQNLYDMVERLVRKEIEKVVDKAQI